MRAFTRKLCYIALARSALRGAEAFSSSTTTAQASFRPSVLGPMVAASRTADGALNLLAWRNLHQQQQQQQQRPKLGAGAAAAGRSRIPDYRKRNYRKAFSVVPNSGRRLVRALLFRPGSKSKRWVLLLVVCAVATALFAPVLHPANAVETVLGAAAPAAQTATAAAHAAGYASNPPVSTLTIARPVSTAAELALTARLVFAAALGAVIGKERSGKQHHPAGVRTMALVSLGAACFTVCSMYGFSNGVGRYDPSRMASNVASGVGFIGAGVITTTGAAAASSSAGAEENNSAGPNGSSSSKKKKKKRPSSSSGGISIVHGLTTAAAIWLSAAVGVGCGVGLCILSTAAAFLTLSILRIGRFAQKLQEKEWRLTELRKLRRRREHKPRLKLLRRRPPEPASSSTAAAGAERRGSAAVLQRSHVIKKHHDTRQEDPNSYSNITDCVFEENEDQFVFLDERPPTGWNETDRMDA